MSTNTLIQGDMPNAAMYTHFGSAGQRCNDDTIWQGGSYERLSREDGDKEESDSIGNQKELIASYVAGRTDIELTSNYEDDGYSGVDFDRPDFKRMMEDIRSKKINCVIVKDLSRLGRNYIETGKLLERYFPFMGVRFIAINDNYDSLNHNAQTDNLIIPFKNLINDAYCADISKKIKSQFEVRRKNGEFIAPFAAFGYMKDPADNNRLIIDEDAAGVVRDIFRWKIEGMSQQGIADKLNSLGSPSPLEYKKEAGSNYTTVFHTKTRAKWTPVAVGRILKNELYAGVMTQGMSTTESYKLKRRVQKPESEWARVDGKHEAIITAEDFALVSRLLQKDTRITPGGKTVYLFSGLLYCGDCGRGLVRKPVKNTEYAYHICSTYKKGGACVSHRISEKALYDAVFQTLTHHIRECVELDRLLRFIDDMPMRRLDAVKLQKQIDAKKAELEKLSRRKIKVYEDYDDGILDRNEYGRFKAIFEAQANEAETALGTLTRELDRAVSGNSENSLWTKHFKKYHNMQSLTRAAVAELVERITVFGDKRVEVTVRYLAEFEAALRFVEDMAINDTRERAVV